MYDGNYFDSFCPATKLCMGKRLKKKIQRMVIAKRLFEFSQKMNFSRFVFISIPF